MILKELKKIKSGERMNPKSILKKKNLQKKINWENFNSPKIFDGDEEIKQAIDGKGKKKEKAYKKLSFIFGECYRFYRNAAEIENGKNKSFIVTEKNEKFCLKGALFCFENKINPYKIFEYWHVMKKDFYDFDIPPLAFITSNYAMETAVNSFDEIKFGNSYATINESVSDIRKILKKEGIELPYDDRFVMTLKHTVDFYLSGRKMYIPEKIRSMINILVNHEK